MGGVTTQPHRRNRSKYRDTCGTQSRNSLFDPTLVVLPTIVQSIIIQLMQTPIRLQFFDPAEDDGQAGVYQPRLPAT